LMVNKDFQIFATRNIQKFYEHCLGRDGHGRTNHVHRTVHILDVISSVSRSSKCTKIVATPLGELTALPRPSSWV